MGLIAADFSTIADTKARVGVFLNIPILANFYVWKGLAIKAGLQPGFKLSSKEEGELGGKRTTFNLDDEVNNFDVAVPLGISYDFGHLVLDARYTIGLKRILKDKSDLDCKNITFQIGLGYKFKL